MQQRRHPPITRGKKGKTGTRKPRNSRQTIAGKEAEAEEEEEDRDGDETKFFDDEDESAGEDEREDIEEQATKLKKRRVVVNQVMSSTALLPAMDPSPTDMVQEEMNSSPRKTAAVLSIESLQAVLLIA